MVLPIRGFYRRFSKEMLVCIIYPYILSVEKQLIDPTFNHPLEGVWNRDSTCLSKKLNSFHVCFETVCLFVKVIIHKSTHRRWNATCVKIKLLILTCMQSFAAVTAYGRIVTLQFGFYWQRPGVMTLTVSSLFLWTEAILLQYSPSPQPSHIHAFFTVLHHFLLRCLYGNKGLFGWCCLSWLWGKEWFMHAEKDLQPLEKFLQ